eukprot:GHVS01042056.1.p1 GENE.GHVS01042056.1~~GHVS01042056.1.p1  ORF type:complete len:185 (+),score=80.14 GHVS01042056.1:109-663(+)
MASPHHHHVLPPLLTNHFFFFFQSLLVIQSLLFLLLLPSSTSYEQAEQPTCQTPQTTTHEQAEQPTCQTPQTTTTTTLHPAPSCGGSGGVESVGTRPQHQQKLAASSFSSSFIPSSPMAALEVYLGPSISAEDFLNDHFQQHSLFLPAGGTEGDEEGEKTGKKGENREEKRGGGGGAEGTAENE